MITLPSINDSSINTQEVRLHFYHCIECLFKVSNPKDFRSHGKYSDRTNLECGICSSDMEYQGQATSDTKRIQKFGLASACNNGNCFDVFVNVSFCLDLPDGDDDQHEYLQGIVKQLQDLQIPVKEGFNLNISVDTDSLTWEGV